MAEVHIVDIDGEQWDIKDSPLTSRVAALETKTTVEIVRKIDEEAFKMNLVKINGEKFLQLHITGYYWSGFIGGIVANFVQDFGMTDDIRCVVCMDTLDNVGRITGVLVIGKNGTISIFPFTENQKEGTYKPCSFYGDVFVKVID